MGRADDGDPTGNGREHQGRDGTGAARLSTLTRLAFLGGPMLSMIDSSVVNIAVPDIVTDLHTSLAIAAWTVSGYLLGLAVDLGRHPVAGLGASAPCPPTRRRSPVSSRRPPAVRSRRPWACSSPPASCRGWPGRRWCRWRWACCWARGTAARGPCRSARACCSSRRSALGPAIGGLLISGFGWRSVFLINLPVGIAAWTGVRRGRRAPARWRATAAPALDLAYLLLLAAGLALATYGASQGPARGWLSPPPRLPGRAGWR